MATRRRLAMPPARDLSLTTGLDEKYTYDALNRLTNTGRKRGPERGQELMALR